MSGRATVLGTFTRALSIFICLCGPASAGVAASGGVEEITAAALRMHADPEQSAEVLRRFARHDDLAAFHLMVILHVWLPRTERTERELADLITAVQGRTAVRSSRRELGVEFPASTSKQWPSESELAETLRFLAIHGSFPSGRPSVSCFTLERSPSKVALVDPNLPGYANALLPTVDCGPEATELPPAVVRYLDAVHEKLKSPRRWDEGNRLADQLRLRTRTMLAGVSPRLVLALQPPASYSSLPRHRPLETWSMLSLANRRIFDHLGAAYEEARSALAMRYREAFYASDEEADAAAREVLWLLAGEGKWAPPDRNGLRWMILSGASAADVADVIDTAIDRDSVPMTRLGMQEDFDAWDYIGEPDPLISVAVHRPDVLRVLLDRGPLRGRYRDFLHRGDQTVDANATSVIGKTPLMTAAEADQIDSVRLLLARGADPNASLNRIGLVHGGRTALMYAAANASVEVIEALLDAGTDPATEDSRGFAALDYLQGRGPTGPNRRLSAAEIARVSPRLPPGKHRNGMTALMRAAAVGNAVLIEELLDAGSDPAMIDADGRISLDYLWGRSSLGTNVSVSADERDRLAKRMSGRVVETEAQADVPDEMTSTSTAGSARQAWSPATAAKLMHQDPQRAAAALRAVTRTDLESAFHLMVLLHDWLPPSLETQAELRLLINDSIDTISLRAWRNPPDWQPSPSWIEDPSMGEFLEILTYIGRAVADANTYPPEISCHTLRKNPDYLAIMEPRYFGSKDHSLPGIECGDSEFAAPPGVEAYFRLVGERFWEGYNPQWPGRFAKYRIEQTIWLQIRVVPETLLSLPVAQGFTGHPEHRPRETWSMLSLANRRVYEPCAQAYDAALPALAEHYESRFGLPREDALAAARIALVLPVEEGHWGPPHRQGLRYMILEGAPIEAIAAAIDGAPSRDAIPATSLSMAYYDGAWEYVGNPDPLISVSVHRPDVLQLLLDKASSAWRPINGIHRVDRTVDPNARNDIGKTPLMTAAEIDSFDSVRILLAHGADPSATLNTRQLLHNHRSALMYAAANASSRVIEALLDAGADTSQLDSQGFGAIDYLTGGGPTGPNRRLSIGDAERIAKRLPVTDHYRFRRTALMLAAATAHARVVEQMLAAGADPEMVDVDRLTALDYAKGRSALGPNTTRHYFGESEPADILGRR